MKKAIEKIQIPYGRVSSDVFALPCVTGAYKTITGRIAYLTITGEIAASGQWLCRDDSGAWFVDREGRV